MLVWLVGIRAKKLVDVLCCSGRQLHVQVPIPLSGVRSSFRPSLANNADGGEQITKCRLASRQTTLCSMLMRPPAPYHGCESKQSCTAV
jgi:hypothetical protein